MEGLAETAARLNDRYLHWSEVRYRVPDEDFETVWGMMRQSRASASTAIGIPGIGLSVYVTPRIERLIGSIESATPPECDPVDILAREAAASCRIEGSSMSARDAAELLRSGTEPTSGDGRMVLNVCRAMGLASEDPGGDLTPEAVIGIHDAILDGLDGRTPGFRETDVVVGDPANGTVAHTPPGPDDVPALMAEVCRLANGGCADLHPLVRAAIVHYLVGYVHPFEDGNGRLARCLFHRCCLSAGCDVVTRIAVSEGIFARRGAYRRAYRFIETDGGDLTYFVSFILGCAAECLGHTDACEGGVPSHVPRRRGGRLGRRLCGTRPRKI